jgi:hypothetical protein
MLRAALANLGFLKGADVTKPEDAVGDDPSAWPISIVPTGYPRDPNGAITVENYIKIDVRGPDFRKFEETMDEMLTALSKSNEIAGEVRDKLIAEIDAGMTILKSPKPNPQVIAVWLLRPLKWIAEKAGGAAIGALAGAAITMLLRFMGLGV